MPHPRFRFQAIAVAERPWRMRIPFHYGVVTLHSAVEIIVACTIEPAGRRPTTGYAAELAAPKWFNKDPALTPEATVDRLRRAVAAAVGLAERWGGDADFGTLARLDEALCVAETDLNALERSYALALVERAVIDALCRDRGRGFAAFLAEDGLDLARDWRFADDLPLAPWLAALTPGASVAVRHTVGLSDPLTRDDTDTPAIAGRPVALADVIRHDRVRHFKVKFAGGDGELERLRRLTALLVESCPDFAVSLDANEAFRDVETFAAVLRAFAGDPALAPFWARIRYVEQPFDRAIALARDVHALSAIKPLLIDESDDTDAAFGEALAAGYRGVSIKTCKGVRRGVRNAARAARERAMSRDAFVSAEDLSVQPGLALQQNVALFAALGLTDAERNGHHFGPGPAALPVDERAALVARHPDLYTPTAVRIVGGALAAGSTLAAPGFGTAVVPDLAA